VTDDGLERLRRWREQDRGVPPAFGRVGARLEVVERGTTSVRLPLRDELLLPDGGATAAVACLAADFGLTTSVISSLPDLRGVATVAMTVDHLALPPVAGTLLARSTATEYADGSPQHATGTLHDEQGRQVAAMSGWFLPAPAETVSAERVGLVREPPAAHLLDLLQVQAGPSSTLRARDALSNALGTLHGGVGAMAGLLAAEAALAPGGSGTAAPLRPLTATFTYLRPTPRDGSVAVTGTVVRSGRRTAASASTLTGPDGRVVLQTALVLG
jgi:acyl-coenzyme A thioesterase PaaI-like protein